ncbi:hypothetical protein D3C72_837880 [compost metagenome]
MLALAQQRGAGEDDRQDGDVVDDLDHRQEPATLQVGVEQGLGVDYHRALRVVALAVVEQLAFEDAADIAGPHERLTHGRGVDIDLQFRRAPGQQVALEIHRHVDHEGVLAAVHGLVQAPRG